MDKQFSKTIQSKHCVACGQPHLFTEFARRQCNADGRSGVCKACLKLRRGTESFKKKQRDYHVSCAAHRRHRSRIYNRRVKYGITPEQYDQLHTSQKGVCAICWKPETKISHGTLCLLAVDHDHATGKVRGLLCDKCNRSVGLLGDDAVVLRRAAEYLGGLDATPILLD